MDRPQFIIIDRFEGRWAVVECSWADGRQSTENLLRTQLPPEAKEGDVLTVTFAVDTEATAARRQQASEAVARLMRERNCGAQERKG